jgi:catechol 2,3-dioxygenase-like lactoylglutathione lyase family enzyme
LYNKKSYLEHVAYHVKDIHWHIRFFNEALGMEVANLDGTIDEPKQVWIVGGLQLISDPNFMGPEGRMGHIAIMTEDLNAALLEVYSWEGVTESPRGKNWILLPDGLLLELIQAQNESIDKLLNIDVSYV